MNHENEFLKFPSNQFVPIKKTPWGGTHIATIKKRYLSHQIKIPNHIGESLEAHWENLLLKWIDAIEPLSVQVHPNNSNSYLSLNECGKSEAWFVHTLENPSPVYLGFKEEYSQEDIIKCLKSADPTECLHSFIPQKNDYISIPMGCVHALGAGILAAEPQIVLPNKEGKTFRLFDWNRRYDTHGHRNENGTPRELHIDAGLNAIDWTLPRGTNIEKTLIKNLKHGERFLGDAYNPFCLQLFEKEVSTIFEPLVKNQFSVITVFSGKIEISSSENTFILMGGETGVLKNADENVNITISSMFTESPCVLIFTLHLSGF